MLFASVSRRSLLLYCNEATTEVAFPSLFLSSVHMSKVYADANAIRGKSWYEYNKFRIEWSSPDRYEIVRKLGGGKYSEVRPQVLSILHRFKSLQVFEGIDTVNSDRCVIKVLKPVAGHKIKREIKVLRNLAGAPNCIALLDVVRDRESLRLRPIMFFLTTGKSLETIPQSDHRIRRKHRMEPALSAPHGRRHPALHLPAPHRP